MKQRHLPRGIFSWTLQLPSQARHKRDRRGSKTTQKARNGNCIPNPKFCTLDTKILYTVTIRQNCSYVPHSFLTTSCWHSCISRKPDKIGLLNLTLGCSSSKLAHCILWFNSVCRGPIQMNHTSQVINESSWEPRNGARTCMLFCGAGGMGCLIPL